MENKGIAFVIMQIGNHDLDKIYSEIYIPAIKDAGLIPKRIDQDNSGKLLKNEIIEYIEKADIIIADITNERPNCYLEIGYAMGLDKYQNLIFAVSEDHYPESKNFKNGGPKIHFDVSGYDILFWDKNNLEKFRSLLTNKIIRRLSFIKPNSENPEKHVWDKTWLDKRREYTSRKFSELGIIRKIEILISPNSKKLNIAQNKLLEICDESQIQTLGWPIAPIFRNNSVLKPLVKSDGILSEIAISDSHLGYDYSYFRKNGQIFISKSLLEENSCKNSIIVDVRIKRATELLLYILRFYSRCNLHANENIEIEIKYSGLLNNDISYGSTGFAIRPKISKENECVIKITTTLADLETNLTEIVNKQINELFILFDFFELNSERIDFISNAYLKEINNDRR